MLVINTMSAFNNAKEQVLKLQEENNANLSKNKRLGMAFCIGGILGTILFVYALITLHNTKSFLIGMSLLCLSGVIMLFCEYAREFYYDKIKTTKKVKELLTNDYYASYIASAYEYRLLPFSYFSNCEIFEIDAKDVLSYNVNFSDSKPLLCITTKNNEYKIKLDEFNFAPNSENEMRLELVDEKIVLTNI